MGDNMDVHSSATWASSIQSENKARKAWKAKYGHQFDLPESTDNSRCSTQMSQRDNNSRAPSQMSSRPATQMSQGSVGEAKKKHLQDLKKKLMSALEEVDTELAQTSNISRSSTRNSTRMS